MIELPASLGIPIELVFTVYGDPIPKGSLKCVGRGGSHRIVEDNPKTGPWRERVAEVVGGVAQAEHHESIGVEITSTIRRPSHHYDRSGGLKPTAPRMPTNTRTGDVDKLARLVLDAMVDARLLVDDAQVVELVTRKAYADEHRSWSPDALDEPGTMIRVYPMNL
jgi:Holliday junction resolvase RusA-like endonuclease